MWTWMKETGTESARDETAEVAITTVTRGSHTREQGESTAESAPEEPHPDMECHPDIETLPDIQHHQTPKHRHGPNIRRIRKIN